MGDAQPGTVLLVVPEGADDFAASFLERADHHVMTYHGPEAGSGCPLLRGEECPQYEGAHGIVFSLDLSNAAHRTILRTYEQAARDVGRDLPMRVVVPPGPAAPDDVGGVLVWAGEPCAADLDGFAALVEAADRFA